ncbi:ATP-binding protein [Candidatus Babeliales bacterium]|nr:ATP-binding protein [Candidatus Babeliales bacterium]MCF7899603.1 ATP-binding protein [Candidatus Babeliales bacterium]
MFNRDLEPILQEYTRFPVIAILGPRQSGKTTLAIKAFKNHVYTSFEDPKTRELAENEPEKFFGLYQNDHGIIIDEFQNVPKILSYIQLEVDTKKRPGYFVLTGSQNFLMNQGISQSLAGRVGILTLLPLSLNEMNESKLTPKSVDELIFKGFYPRIYSESFPPDQLYPSYIQTYIERDVRQLSNVGDLNAFKKFVKLCAGRVGQILNLSELAGVSGMSVPTMQRWLSILEASYIVFLLQPYANNFSRRIIRHPKIYFYDMGILCYLLDIESPERLAIDRLRGSIFENFVIADLCKQYFNIGKQPPVYFWRDKNGAIEVDCIVDDGRKLFPIEIKSGESIALDFFSNLKKWNALAHAAAIPLGKSFIAYGGEKSQGWDDWATIGWRDLGLFVKQIRDGKPV